MESLEVWSSSWFWLHVSTTTWSIVACILCLIVKWSFTFESSSVSTMETSFSIVVAWKVMIVSSGISVACVTDALANQLAGDTGWWLLPLVIECILDLSVNDFTETSWPSLYISECPNRFITCIFEVMMCQDRTKVIESHKFFSKLVNIFLNSKVLFVHKSKHEPLMLLYQLVTLNDNHKLHEGLVYLLINRTTAWLRLNGLWWVHQQALTFKELEDRCKDPSQVIKSSVCVFQVFPKLLWDPW